MSEVVMSEVARLSHGVTTPCDSPMGHTNHIPFANMLGNKGGYIFINTITDCHR